MPPNQSLIIDSSSYGDALHRDLYIRDKIQASTGEISNSYYLVNGSTKTVPVLEKVNTLGSGEGEFTLYTASTSTRVNTSTDAMLSVTVTETDINSTIVNFAGTSINLSNPSAAFFNAGDTTLAGDASITGTLGVTGAATLTSTLQVGGNVDFVGTTATFTNDGASTLKGVVTAYEDVTLTNGAGLDVAGDTTLRSTLGVSGAVTAQSDVSFVGTGFSFVNQGTTNLFGATEVHNSLTVDNGGSLTVAGATILQNTLDVTGVLTANNNVSFVGSSSSFTNAGTTTLTGTTTMHSDLTLDNSAGLTVAGPTLLQGTLGVASSLTADAAVSFVGTAFPFTVNGPTTINNSLAVTGELSFSGSLGMEGDLDMKTNQILNVSSLRNTDLAYIDINSTLGEIDTFVGTSGTPILSVTSAGVNINGDITILGDRFELQSTTVEVQDKNIALAYKEPSLANCDGAGITIGDATLGTYTLPSFTYQAVSNSFLTNVDLRSVNGLDNTYCTLGSGVVTAYNAGGSKYAALEYDCVKFSNTWRMRYDDANDCIKLEKYNGVDTWVTKFTFTS